MLRLFVLVSSFALLGPTINAAEKLPKGVTATSMGERIQRYDFHSAALNKKMAFVVVEPQGYRPKGKAWPVLFFLHGLGRKETTLIDDAPSRARLLAQPYVIVLPRGENGWYFDSPVDPARHYAQYLDEVIALAGRVVNLSTERAQRAVGGWSAGGFGSVWACLRHPDQFSTLATIIAVVDFPGAESRFPLTPATFGTDPARWRDFNPLNRATELRGLNIQLVIGEKASDAVMNERLSAVLAAAKIPHEVKRLPGGHTFPVVQAGLGPVLDFVRQHIMPAE
ncbi:MAG: hypothetical protein IAE77_02340 [Prosthecobacter sp.]|jgi:S-formylglutathione hydrolase FrmB|uniref:alpha/beta hydrolase n=1 Tax=Prosthecobacter sp. TaxID=1965333 RepID=UPI001A0C1945|nr:alpha/beta hydrolase-fold protein [Prosthecobacter sp.]MBE2282283.1 hypothetical protein [Prosthecobacter sp.]